MSTIPTATVRIDVRQSGAIGIFEPQDFTVAGPFEPGDRDAIFAAWQEEFGDEWEPRAGFRILPTPTTPDALAGELLDTATNGTRSDVRTRLLALADTNPAAAISAAFYLGQYANALNDGSTVGRLGRLLSDDVEPFDAPGA